MEFDVFVVVGLIIDPTIRWSDPTGHFAGLDHLLLHVFVGNIGLEWVVLRVLDPLLIEHAVLTLLDGEALSIIASWGLTRFTLGNFSTLAGIILE